MRMWKYIIVRVIIGKNPHFFVQDTIWIKFNDGLFAWSASFYVIINQDL